MVIIPTVDRPKLVKALLLSIPKQSKLPIRVILVDASQEVFSEKIEGIDLEVLKSPIRSAASQRNLGIEKILASNIHFQYCFFLDDDVTIPQNYFESLLRTLSKPNVIGVSGIAIGENESFPVNSFLNRFIGLAGQPGMITKAAINVPVRSSGYCHKVEWLIGCSGWCYDIIKTLRFEDDFPGQSIFEDVIFSVRASQLGDLYVDSGVVLKHHLENEGRPNRKDYFSQWIRNRFRLRKICRKKFSYFKFWGVNLAFAFKVAIVERDLEGLKGILKGSLMAAMGK